jgi:hypothetical protein
MIDQNQDQVHPKTAVSPYQSTGYAPIAYLPTPAQLERKAALRRFNRLYVYLPLAIFTTIAVIVIITLFWGAFSGDNAQRRVFISALADIVIILGTIPLILAFSIVPIGAVAAYFYVRSLPKQEHSRSHVFLWKLNNGINKVGDKTDEIAPKLIKPITASHGVYSYLSTFTRVIVGSERE